MRWLMPPSAIETYPYRTFARAPSSRHLKLSKSIENLMLRANSGQAVGWGEPLVELHGFE